LTNRHVVSAAPIVAQAVLTNYEEVDLKPVYRDPVHDFGFMQVKIMQKKKEKILVGADIEFLV
jgi:S1-C subfamily serine protease